MQASRVSEMLCTPFAVSRPQHLQSYHRLKCRQYYFLADYPSSFVSDRRSPNNPKQPDSPSNFLARVANTDEQHQESAHCQRGAYAQEAALESAGQSSNQAHNVGTEESS